MTQEQKAKAYDEALEKAKTCYQGGLTCLEDIFPELKESEDEKTRKWLIEIVEEIRKVNPTNADHNGNCSEAIAWLDKQYADPIKEYWRGYNEGKQNVLDKYAELEKQGEQKPFDYENANIQQNDFASIEPDDLIEESYQQQAYDIIDMVTEKPAWSEEDERIYNSIMYSFAHNYPLTIQQQDFVKSLRLQSRWKPSDEQIKSVKEAACYSSVFSEKTIDNLISLSKQLKKLREG